MQRGGTAWVGAEGRRSLSGPGSDRSNKGQTVQPQLFSRSFRRTMEGQSRRGSRNEENVRNLRERAGSGQDRPGDLARSLCDA